MILADKIIMLRKKSGLSQEELAEKLGVSRQSISKWEGAQSVPDLNKILAMAQVFDVTTDFLLKDEIDAPDYQGESAADDVPHVHHVSMEEANKFLALKEKNARTIALATFLCILAPVFLIGAGGISECAYVKAYDNALIGFGLVTMLLIVTVAVVMFIRCGNRSEQYSYIEKEMIETEYGVSGMVKDRKAKFKSIYDRNNLIGTVICILSVIPLFAGAFLEDGFIAVCGLCITLIVAGIGVMFFIRVGVIQSALQQLLQEGDFTKQKKGKESLSSAISTVYWLLTTAIYLAVSFSTNSWKTSWIVWAVAAVLFPAVLIICNRSSGKKN